MGNVSFFDVLANKFLPGNKIVVDCDRQGLMLKKSNVALLESDSE
jgi:hypothetical protein